MHEENARLQDEPYQIFEGWQYTSLGLSKIDGLLAGHGRAQDASYGYPSRRHTDHIEDTSLCDPFPEPAVKNIQICRELIFISLGQENKKIYATTLNMDVISHQIVRICCDGQILCTLALPNRPLGLMARVMKIKRPDTSAPDPVPITGSR